MKAIAVTANPENNYRESMQQAAVAFLFRREGLHLAGDCQVLENCRSFLANTLEVPPHLVPRIAELAVAEFESMTTGRLKLLGICPTSSIFRASLILLDTATQQRHQVPARYLPRRMQHPSNTSK
ncbi:hypothetical protein ACLPJF_13445 [Pseudomonas vlassakiae]|uniref:hypothetical protein n=1 Tax=Pseudomonas vlassakiae TaxID=485888 RepID=UPI003D2ADB92